MYLSIIHKELNWIDFFFADHQGHIVLTNPYGYSEVIKAHDGATNVQLFELFHLPFVLKLFKCHHVIMDFGEFPEQIFWRLHQSSALCLLHARKQNFNAFLKDSEFTIGLLIALILAEYFEANVDNAELCFPPVSHELIESLIKQYDVSVGVLLKCKIVIREWFRVNAEELWQGCP